MQIVISKYTLRLECLFIQLVFFFLKYDGEIPETVNAERLIHERSNTLKVTFENVVKFSGAVVMLHTGSMPWE